MVPVACIYANLDGIKVSRYDLCDLVKDVWLLRQGRDEGMKIQRQEDGDRQAESVG